MTDEPPKKKRGGRRKGSGRPKGHKQRVEPKDFMNMLVPAGPRVDHGKAETIEGEPVDMDQRTDWVDPVEFCKAVINGDLFTLGKCGVVEPISVEHKLMAAKVAAPYTNKKKPVETLQKYEFSWADGISEGDQRVEKLRMDMTKQNDDATETTH